MVDGKQERMRIEMDVIAEEDDTVVYTAHVFSLGDPNPRGQGWYRQRGKELLGNLVLFDQQRAAGGSASSSGRKEPPQCGPRAPQFLPSRENSSVFLVFFEMGGQQGNGKEL